MSCDNSSAIVKKNRPLAFYVITTFFALSVVLMLIGQTTAVFSYNFAVQLGFQSGSEQIGIMGVQIIRAFCVSDTLVFIPLTIISVVGLCQKKRWSLFTTASTSGISIYWVIAYGFMVQFSKGTPSYHFTLEVADWLVMVSYVCFGVWSLFYLMFNSEELVV